MPGYNPTNNYPMINGKMYSWAKIKIKLAGVTLVSVSAISYREMEAKVLKFGAGQYPIGSQDGQITTECSITLPKDTIAELEDAAPYGRIQNLAPFDIEVCFIVDVASKIRCDILKDCQFTENGVDASVDNNIDNINLPLLCPRIDWGYKL